MSKDKDSVNEKFVTSESIASQIESKLKVFFRFNALESRVEAVNQKGEVELFTRVFLACIYEAARAIGFENSEKLYLKRDVVLDAIQKVARKRVYNPIKDYFKKAHDAYLADPQDHISVALSHIEFGSSFHESFFRKWLVGVLARYEKSFQNSMLVLTGKQGIGKSTLLMSLSKGFPEFHLEESVNLGDHHQCHSICTKLIWVFEEFNCILKSSSRNAFKALMTKEHDTYRPPYGTVAEKHRRICSFVGTTNDFEFLTDPTGNRRYLVTELISIDHEWFRTHFDPNPLWGQVVDILKKHGQDFCRLSVEELAYQESDNEDRLHVTPFSEAFNDWIEIATAIEVIPLKEILDKINECGLGNPNSLSYQIADCMQKIGAKRERKHRCGVRQTLYFGVRWKPTKGPNRTVEQQNFIKSLHLGQ